MKLRSLYLQSFRNHQKQTLSLSPQATIILGPNASGKTNLVEAIYLLSAGKSFRAETEQEMIAYGSEMSNAKIQMTNEKDEEIRLEIMLTVGEVQGRKAPYKKFLVNGVPKRMVDFVGNLKCVIFWPQDLELVTDSPAKRRRYLDGLLGQVDWEYRRSLSSYERGVRSRNRLLAQIREGEAGRSELLFWNQLLIKSGQYLGQKRAEFIAFFNEQGKRIDGGTVKMVYDQSLISEARFTQYQDAEVAAGVTLVGPHRDDFVVMVKGDKGNRGDEGRDLHSFGSRGEQRLAVLWLKLVELDFIEKKTDERPILLLDDIFSELDHEHRTLVMAEIPKQQTIITTTDEHFIEGEMKKAQVIRLER